MEDGAEWIHGERKNALYKMASDINELQPLVHDKQKGMFYSITSK